MLARTIIFNSFQILGYILSVYSLNIIAKTFGNDNYLDHYWLLFSLIPFCAFLVYPFRELYLKSVLQDGNYFYVLSIFLVFTAYSMLIIFFLYILHFNILFDNKLFFSFLFSFILFELVSHFSSALSFQIIFPLFKILNSFLIIFLIGYNENIDSLILSNIISYLFVSCITFYRISLKCNTSFDLNFNHFYLHLKKYFHLFLAYFNSNLFSQFSNFIFRYSMTFISVGILSSFQYAFTIYGFILAFLVIPSSNFLWGLLINNNQLKADFLFRCCLLFLTIISISFVFLSDDLLNLSIYFDIKLINSDSISYISLMIFTIPFTFIITYLTRFFTFFENPKIIFISSFINSFIILIGAFFIYFHKIDIIGYTYFSSNFFAAIYLLFCYKKFRPV